MRLDVDSISKLDYYKIQDRLHIVLCDSEHLRRYPAEVVYTPCGSWSAIYCMFFPINDEKQVVTIITDSDLDAWKIDVSQLHSDAVAIENSHRPAYLADIDSLLVHPCNIRETENLYDAGGILDIYGILANDVCRIFMLTNIDGRYGASVIARDGVLEKVGKLLGSSYYIIPSSVHELLIVPDSEYLGTCGLEKMVREVNTTELDPRDILSYVVQYYDRETGVLKRKTE